MSSVISFSNGHTASNKRSLNEQNYAEAGNRVGKEKLGRELESKTDKDDAGEDGGTFVAVMWEKERGEHVENNFREIK